MLAKFEVCEEVFNRNGLEFNKNLHKKLDTYAEFLCEYNEKVNLTAITDAEGIFIKHFLDSIFLDKYSQIPKNARIIDVGTGAGLPSVPLKLYRDDLKVTLLDSLKKRVVFLQELIQRLEIEAECVHNRAEILAKDMNYRESYDISVARAVCSFANFMRILSALCKGWWLFYSNEGP